MEMSPDVQVHVRSEKILLKTRRRSARYHLQTINPNPVERQAILKIPSDDVVLATKRDKMGAERLATLGKGKYGTVYRAVLTLQETRQQAAVKCCNTPYTTSENNDGGELILREAQFIQHLHSTGYVPRLHGIVSGCHPDLGEGLCIVQTLFADGVTLWSVLDDFDKLPRSIRRHMAWNLAKGLKAIHKKGVLLNDLHERNVLVDVQNPNRPVQYIDMGLATYGTVYNIFSDNLAHIKHLAPEVREGGPVTTASDVYSLGIIIRELNREVNDTMMIEAVELCLDTDLKKRDLDLVILMLKDPRDNRKANRNPFHRRRFRPFCFPSQRA